MMGMGVEPVLVIVRPLVESSGLLSGSSSGIVQQWPLDLANDRSVPHARPQRHL
jgi:hypothetical protein